MSNLLLILTPISKIFFKNKKKSKKNQKSVFNTFKPFTHPFILLTSLKNIQSIKKNDKIRNNIKKKDWWVKRKTKKKEPK
jgi:hypothetical protein